MIELMSVDLGGASWLQWRQAAEMTPRDWTVQVGIKWLGGMWI